jgi:hypothetical protein
MVSKATLPAMYAIIPIPVNKGTCTSSLFQVGSKVKSCAAQCIAPPSLVHVTSIAAKNSRDSGTCASPPFQVGGKMDAICQITKLPSGLGMYLVSISP